MIEILRPNAPGDETNIHKQFPDVGAHWDKVDEVVPDIDTYVANDDDANFQRDLYILPAHSGNGTINSITVYARCWHGLGFGTPSVLKIALKTGGVAHESSVITIIAGVVDHSNQWDINPQTGVAWTWDDIDALQIGVSLRAVGYMGATIPTYCTQVYVDVDSTPVAPAGCLPIVAAAAVLIAGIIAGIILLL